MFDSYNQAIASTLIFVEIAREFTIHQDTPNQVRVLPHTTQNLPQSLIAISEMIMVPLPSTDNTK